LVQQAAGADDWCTVMNRLLSHNMISPSGAGIRYLDTLADVKKLAASIHLLEQPPAAIIVDNLSGFEHAGWVIGNVCSFYATPLHI
jgi:hypothetical protein